MGAVEVPDHEWNVSTRPRGGGRRGRRARRALPVQPSTEPRRRRAVAGPSPRRAPRRSRSTATASAHWSPGPTSWSTSRRPSGSPSRCRPAGRSSWFRASSGPTDRTPPWASTIVDNLYVDPCGTAIVTHEPPVGPTVDDLVAALDATPNLDARATDVTMAGYAGKQVDLIALAPWSLHSRRTAPLSPRVRDSLDWPPPDPTETRRLSILDVGGHRLVISRNTRQSATTAARADQQAIFDSIRIELTSSPGSSPSSNPSRRSVLNWDIRPRLDLPRGDELRCATVS